jgi:hypothetical protein
MCCLLCLDVQVGLFQLVDLITDELCFLDLLLDYREVSILFGWFKPESHG